MSPFITVSSHLTDLVIRRTVDPVDLSTCASMLSSSDPWITLGIVYNDSIVTLSDPGREVYVAQHGESILGFIVVEIRGAFTGYIKSLCVSPLNRNKGLGRLLMKYAEQRIFREKPNVFLCVSGFNHEAQRFYHALGYSVVGVLDDYLISGQSEILMRKTIAPINDFQRIR